MRELLGRHEPAQSLVNLMWRITDVLREDFYEECRNGGV